jgi:predicted transcriptional regulator
MVPNPEQLGYLLQQRHECLRSLSTDPKSKRALVDDLEIPRSTLDGIMRDLEDADLVSYANGEWRVTHFGQCALSTYNQHHSHLCSLSNAAPIINVLSPEAPIGCEFLIDVEVYEGSSAIPDDVLHVFLESVSDATRIRGFSPVAIVAYADQFYANATNVSNYQLEIVLPQSLFECLSARNPAKIKEALQDANVNLLQASIPVSFGLWIADTNQAGIIVYLDHGIRGILINDTDEAIAWAEAQYDRVRQEADSFKFSKH